jgi:hypothetical protein
VGIGLDKGWRLNAICPYFTMFPLSFPLRVLRRVEQGWVLDPFCGRGTTNFAARLLGLPSVGVDSSRVAHAVTAAKLASATQSRVTKRCNDILAGSDPVDVPEGPFWERAFHPRTLTMVCKLREALLHPHSQTDVVLRALILGILHGPRYKKAVSYLSNQMPRTYATKPTAALRFWRRHGNRPRFVDAGDVVSRRAGRLLDRQPPPAEGRVYLHDSRLLAELNLPRTFSAVVTSPPYLGMRSYRPDQWLREWFLGSPPEVTYSVENQIATADQNLFVNELGKVWAAAATVCIPRARLIVRFGAMAGIDADPRRLLRESLNCADVNWKVTGIREVAPPPDGRRQSDQFGGGKTTRREIDLYAVLS